jgi:hypothetical protein
MGEISIPSCPSQADLLDLIAGRLSRERHDALDVHVRGCGRCQAELNALDDPDDEFLSTVRGLLNPDLIRMIPPLRDAIADLELLPSDRPDRPRVGNVVICPKCRQMVSAVQDRITRCPRCGTTLPAVRQSSAARETRILDPGNAADPARNEFAGFDRYRFVRELSSDGIYTTFLAHDQQLSRAVVVVLRRKRMRSKRRPAEPASQGVSPATKLDHSNIVPLIQAGVHEGMAFVVFEHVRGRTLREIVEQGRPERRTALEWIAAIAQAMEHAHSEGTIHRAIKPSNILIDSEQQARLTGFGLPASDSVLDDLSALESVADSIVYLSPEQAAGVIGGTDKRTDVYSLGIVMYELLAGTVPFKGFPEVVIGQVCRLNPPTLRSVDRTIDKSLEEICLKAIAKDPSNRYQTAGAFVDEINRWLEGNRLAKAGSGWRKWLVRRFGGKDRPRTG